MIQRDIFRVIDGLIRGGKKVVIETNGSVCIKDVNKKAIIIMDIKCPLSGQSGSFLAKNLKHIRSKDEINFVISGRKDYLWAKREAERFIGKKCGILFSPARGLLKASELAKWMLDDDSDARLNIQLHKVIWPGRNRGV